jgi:hypothetical protein
MRRQSVASLDHVIEIVGTLTLAYPKAEIKKGMSTVWHGVLQDIPDEILDAAAQQVLSENTWFPSVAELRQKSLQLMKPLFPTWGEAWDECHKKCIMGRRGEFSHPLVEKAYDCLGNWDTLLSDDVPTARAQFRQIYEQLVYRAESDVKMLPEAKQVSEQYRLGVSELVKKLSA